MGVSVGNDPGLADLWNDPTPTAPWAGVLQRQTPLRVNADTLHPPLQRWLAVPVLDNTEVVAVLGLGNKATPYNDHDEDALRILAQNLWQLLDRRRRERRLQAQQAELDHFFSANLDLFCIADHHGTLLRVNGAWERVTGHPTTHLQGRRFLDFIHPADRPGTLAALAQLRGQTDVVDFDNRWIGLDGGIRHIEWRAKAGGDRFYASARDVTERKAQTATIEKLSAAVAQNPYPVVITDLEARIEYANPACCRSTGYRLEELLGQNPRLLHSGKTPASVYRAMWERLVAGQPWQGELTNRRKDGSDYIEQVLIYPVRNSAGEVVNYLAHKEDVTEKKAAAERIRQLSHFDQLTGLPNRAQLQERFTQALERVRQNGQALTLMTIDLDHFKVVNDALGTASGDLLLRELAQRLQAQLRDQDTVSRQSGDAFLVLLPDTNQHQAATMATRLLHALQQPLTLANQELIVGASIGVALFPNDGDNLESLQMAAESAMYQVKQDGRNAFRFYAPDMQRHTARTLALGNALKQALARDELHLVYQPQCRLGDGRVVGAEALLRWNNPQWGAVSPAEFVPMAEENGLIVPIGDWVLRSATQQLRRWQDTGRTDLTVAVNLSAIQFAQAWLAEHVTRIAAEAGVPPHSLELELTEAVALKHPEAARQTMAALSAAGFRLSIDDFGTGYSSMSYLKRFAVDKLKIDQSFVRELTVDRDDQAIVTAIVQMAHSLGMTTIAEGVETEAQRDFLRERGCDELQGYLFSRPLAPADFEAFLARTPAPP
jgi:diguanylate cyclase (GGDEF)-like protein/PAS domain S-box-containing protein